jgi:serine/threonine protein kinase
MLESEAKKVLKQVLDALKYMHGQGVCHRDIKPDNILLIRTGSGSLRVKVADFNVAKRFDAGTSMMTKTGVD